MVVSTQVLPRLRDFADALDRDAPGRLSGLYALGSVALGDYRDSLSNLDVIAASDTAWDDASLVAIRRALGALRKPTQPPRVACVTWDQLAMDPAEVEAPGFVGRTPVPGGDLVNPFSWAVLRSAAVCVRGEEYPRLGHGELRAWAAERLGGWWAQWLADIHLSPLLLRRNIAEPVLEVARLEQIVASGRVVSKLEAGEAAEGVGPPNRQRSLKDSVGYRRGARMSMYWGPYERRRHGLDYIRSTVGSISAGAVPGQD
jgi:hypothetical protein